MAIQRVYRRPDVQRLTGWSRSTLYERMAAGSFPRPIRLNSDATGRGAVGWLESEIESWQKSRIAERDRGAA